LTAMLIQLQQAGVVITNGQWITTVMLVSQRIVVTVIKVKRTVQEIAVGTGKYKLLRLLQTSVSAEE
jgi:hypothetical protein